MEIGDSIKQKQARDWESQKEEFSFSWQLAMELSVGTQHGLNPYGWGLNTKLEDHTEIHRSSSLKDFDSFSS